MQPILVCARCGLAMPLNTASASCPRCASSIDVRAEDHPMLDDFALVSEASGRNPKNSTGTLSFLVFAIAVVAWLVIGVIVVLGAVPYGGGSALLLFAWFLLTIAIPLGVVIAAWAR